MAEGLERRDCKQVRKPLMEVVLITRPLEVRRSDQCAGQDPP